MKWVCKFLICLFLFFVCLPMGKIFASDMMDINTASLQQLDTLAGIGPTYAQRIIDGRPYSSVDDLLRVKGIGPATLQKIKDQGLACVNCQTQQSAQQTTTNQNLNVQNPNPNQIQNPIVQNINLPTATATVAASPTTYPSGIVFNEILPNPQGTDETEEWIELYNTNNFEADLSGWKIQDAVGTITNFIFPAGAKILAQEYLILKRPDTKIMLNNAGDGLTLFSPDGKAVDSIEFKNAPLGFSYNKTASGWKWSQKLTPGLANVVLSSAPAAKTKISKNAVKNNADDKTAAALVSSLPQEKPFSFLLFSGILLAVVLGIIFFVIIIKFRARDSER